MYPWIEPLADDIRAAVFALLDADDTLTGEEAGAIAQKCKQLVLDEITKIEDAAAA